MKSADQGFMADGDGDLKMIHQEEKQRVEPTLTTAERKALQRVAKRLLAARQMSILPSCVFSPRWDIRKLNLHGYQMMGVVWLLKSWSCGLNCILADDMGIPRAIPNAIKLLQVLARRFKSLPF